MHPAQPGQYFPRLDLGTKAAPQTAQRFKSLSRKISASSVPSSGKTAQRNHLQQTENEIICGPAQGANAIVDTMSATVIKMHNPGMSDTQLRQLITAHSDEDEFCRYVIQRDINGIALALRETHKDDFSASQRITR